jgi:hypothetical protein
MDFLPRYGPPDFRYTGSDSAVYVWNLGWPLAEFMYDSRSGFHDGPMAVLLLFLQATVLVLGAAAVILIRWLHRGAEPAVACDRGDITVS